MRESIKRVNLFPRKDLDSHPNFEPEGEDRRLFEAIYEDKLIVFYGAGVSRLAECASWGELAVKIVNQFPGKVFSDQDKTILKKMAVTDARRVISICYSRTLHDGNLKELYYSIIKKSVTPPETKRELFKKIHTKLFQLNALSYVTTNIDKGMETVDVANSQSNKIFNLTTDFYNSERDLQNSNTFYLHGSVDSIEDTIFTVDNYHKFYAGQDQKKSTAVSKFLKDLFHTEHCVLFIGYGLEEQEILQSIFTATAKEQMGKREPRHFLLAPVYSKDLAEFNIRNMFLEIYSVKAIPYFIDYDGYGRLTDVLDMLRRTIEENRKPTIDLFDEIISGQND